MSSTGQYVKRSSKYPARLPQYIFVSDKKTNVCISSVTAFSVPQRNSVLIISTPINF